ncbi:hypothetical protein PanWU01x14_112960, partial [Parasponia andersonii]
MNLGLVRGVVRRREAVRASWRSRSSSYCSTEMALDLFVPLSRIDSLQKLSSSRSTISRNPSSILGFFLGLVSLFSRLGTCTGIVPMITKLTIVDENENENESERVSSLLPFFSDPNNYIY